MNVLRVALYAGETVGSVTELPAVGKPLAPEMLGPAHLLFRRVLVHGRQMDSGEVQFDAPLRLKGRQPKGSDLLHEQNLKKLLSWPMPTQQPDLAIVVVDADGDHQRKRRLEDAIRDPVLPVVVAVAVQEFEAWLLSDHQCVSRAVGREVDGVDSPEDLGPREAKEHLRRCMGELPHEQLLRIRREIAEGCDLDIVARRCTHFERVRRELRTAP